MRPGELFALDWERDIDLRAKRSTCASASTRASTTCRSRTACARSRYSRKRALLSLPERSGVVFRSKRAEPMSQPRLTGYWSQISAASGLQDDFYGVTKHCGVHYMKVRLGLPNHDIAEQAGWAEAAVEQIRRDDRPGV